jgi:hypothetical protein
LEEINSLIKGVPRDTLQWEGNNQREDKKKIKRWIRWVKEQRRKEI